eukprot:CAMPEP_0118951874 /NCGR_PEP_ID=MMETSP1169-20130426/53856_1 /TAXON_ID=36882 /ORGANISM="Pyramimonas obovata, Strain CCMP722" /LENGTH=320 /DNA_ID=CAMNT_0006899013 /DNA_START=288 /DNA_END=1247 /DNA_ORIENTATION=+
MGCTFSIFKNIGNTLTIEYPQTFTINHRSFRVIKQLGEGGYSYVYLVREVSDGQQNEYALKKILAQTPEQLAVAKSELEIHGQFADHPGVLTLLDSAVVPLLKNDRDDEHFEVYLLFPVFKDGDLMQYLGKGPKNTRCFTSVQALRIFDQICAAIENMHNTRPAPYAHWDLKPANILLSFNGGVQSTGGVPHSSPMRRPEGTSGAPIPLAVLSDFGSARLARVEVRGRREALALQEFAEMYASAPYRPPELWDVSSNAKVDERVDVWALGCLLYALLYREGPFDWQVDQNSIALAVMSGRVRYPNDPSAHYPAPLHQLVE